MPARAAEPLTVAAAASLQLAFRNAQAAWEGQGGGKLTLVFSASGILAQQIEQGAPYDLFASADEGYVRDLAARGLLLPDSKAIYAEGVLALIVRSPQALARAPEVLDGPALGLLRAPAFKVIALANPAFAPYGVAARQALERAGLWSLLQPRLVYGDNVRQTLTYVQTGDADAALVSASLIAARADTWRPLAPTLYDPIRQALGVVTRSAHRAEARRFAAFLLGPEGRRILSRYGLRPPAGPSSG
jgi:molybdate transport system substrate-binding protein